MSTDNGVKIPDGKWIMPAELFLDCDGVEYEIYSYALESAVAPEESYVRFHVNNGEISYFNYALAVGNWYRSRGGSPYARGHTFIDTLDELVALSSDLPYGWRGV